MERSTWNDGWSVRPKASTFLERADGPRDWAPVRLPHDALLDVAREPSAGPASGYFGDGAWEYRKEFAVPEDLAGQCVVVEFEGVYRGASVYVNDVRVGHRPYGYSTFALRIDEFLHVGADNVVRVEALVQSDPRWYSGAGIYRNVHFAVGGPVRLAFDSLRVSTPSVDATGALVEVSTIVESDASAPTATVVRTELRDPDGAVVAVAESPVTAWRAGLQQLIVPSVRQAPGFVTGCRTLGRETSESVVLIM